MVNRFTHSFASTALAGGIVLGARIALGNPVLPLPVDQPESVVSILVRHPVSPQLDAFPLSIVSEIDDILDGDRATLGDTDRDGRPEIIDLHYTSDWRIVIAERQPDNSYTVSYPLGFGYLLTYATGDLDDDCKMEIIGQSGGQVLVYESANPWSHPSTLAWTSPPLSNVGGNTTVGDSDSDGRMEIIHSVNYFSGTARLVIFENRGDNHFEQVFDAPTPGNPATGDKIVLDLDQDGKREIALCGLRGWLYLFEAVADDTWEQVWVDSTGMSNAYGAEGGTDSDGNGRPELFVQGNDRVVFPPTTWPARVYESAADNEFHLVTTIPVPGSGGGGTFDASGDLDGDGDREYMPLEVRAVWDPPPGGVWVYTAVSEGLWEPVAKLENPGNVMAGQYACDMNSNGRAEILWTSPQTSRIYAYEPTSDLAGQFRPRSLVIAPNPIRRSAKIRWNPMNPVARALLVYDVSGRLVERRDVQGHSLEWQPAALPAGVYFFRLQNAKGHSIAAARALVLESK